MITVNEFKEYARVDADEQIISTLLSSASAFFKNKGIREEYLNEEEVEQLNLAILMLMTHYYENRGVATEKNLKAIPLGIQSITTELKFRCLLKQREAGL